MLYILWIKLQYSTLKMPMFKPKLNLRQKFGNGLGAPII